MHLRVMFLFFRAALALSVAVRRLQRSGVSPASRHSIACQPMKHSLAAKPLRNATKAAVTFVLMLLTVVPAHADEGMWMLGHLDKATRRTLKEMGLRLSADELYHPRRPSLKDAVVSFGGFCSGVVVSGDGLVLTNHHCGFSSIQQHSTVEHNYLNDGFVACNRDEELPCPELYVRFLLRQENVTRRVLSAVKPDMDEMDRSQAIDSVRMQIVGEVFLEDSTLVGTVDACYAGNEYWLSVYRDYYDVRLVFAPPASVGKFGWDTDNWQWPRHTGDFAVFRIYAGTENRPAAYSPDNVPYHPAYVAPISLKGYDEGAFCMTLGYPGVTQRYLSSFGIEEMMHNENQARIDLRAIKQAIWKRAMNRSDSLRIKYASKYDESSNYWKNSVGMNRAIRRLHVLERKRQQEAEMQRWIDRSPEARVQWQNLLPHLQQQYESRREANHALSYFVEAFLNGPELVDLALSVLNFDVEAEPKLVADNLRKIASLYANTDMDVDKEVLVAMLEAYRQHVEPEYLPLFYEAIDTLHAGNIQAYADSIYAHSQLVTPRGLQRFVQCDTTFNVYEDPAVGLVIDVLTGVFEMNMQMHNASIAIGQGERQLNAVVRQMGRSRNLYPDANSTLRLSFGTVSGYAPYDGAYYRYYTTTRGILEKVKAHAGNRDFHVRPELLELLQSGDYGRYADSSGEMNVCFISDNDITGGNSGSAMFNGRGELMGLAFDGNWEAMSSDLLYEPALQRTIGVDIRYVLFIIDKYGQAGNLIRELDIRE